MKKKYLSLREAQNLIPEIKLLLIEVMQLNKSLDLMGSIDLSHEDDFEFAKFNIEASRNFHEVSVKFYRKLTKLLSLGCIVKDVNLGLVDFFSLYQNKEIMLCYQVTENKIQYWHEIDAEFHERKHISKLNDSLS